MTAAGPSQQAPSDASRSGLIGKIIAQRYKVHRHLGRGAMGSVFLAEHIVLKCPYALKILHPELAAHEETVQRFVREAQTTASIQHPNVCASTDFGKLPDGSFYLVMEYLEGKTLRQLNKELPQLPLARAVHITRQMLSALGRAHELGIVHRDLKPENIMLVAHEGDPDFVKIMDFGLASLVTQNEDEEEARLTMTGIVYGTPVYMSPEQVRAEHNLTGRADLYAIGAMLFEMITGSIPFQGPNVTALLAQHLTEPVCSVRERAPNLDLPAAIDPVIQKAMAKKASDRFDNAQQFIQALDAVMLAQNGGLVSQPYEAFPYQSFSGDLAPIDHAADTLMEHDERSPSDTSRPIADTHPGPLPTTPRQATPLPARERSLKVKLLLAIVAVLCLIGIVGAVLVLQKRGESATPEFPTEPTQRIEAMSTYHSQTLAEARAAYLEERPVVLSASKKLGDEDQSSQALDMLEALTEHAQDAHYHYLVGQAAANTGDTSRAMDAYSRAIVLEPDYFYDSTFLEDLTHALSSPNEESVSKARALITTTRLEDIYPLLGERAQHISGRKRRVALKDYLVSTNTYEKLPPWRVASIDLRTASGCRAHSEAIKALAKSENPEALKPLKRLDQKPRRGCGKRKNKDCYGCVRDDLATAISILEARFPEASGHDTHAPQDEHEEEEIDVN